MKTAFVASLIAIVGIILFIAILLFGNPIKKYNLKTDTSISKEINKENERDAKPLLKDFQYLDSCNKYVLKDFLNQDIFENNKPDLKANTIAATIEAGKKLEKFLVQLEKEQKENEYTLILEGNLVNEWAPDFDRNNTWAYRTSYDRALAVYKLWLQNGINIRKYKIETIISGDGYYGLCPIKDKKSKRFSVQLIPRN